MTLHKILTGRAEVNSAWVKGEHMLSMAAERIEYVMSINVTSIKTDVVGASPPPRFWLAAAASADPVSCVGARNLCDRVSTRDMFALDETTYELSLVLTDFTGGLLYPGPIGFWVFLFVDTAGGSTVPLVCGTKACGNVGTAQAQAVVEEVRATVVPAVRSPADIVVRDLFIDPYTPTPNATAFYGVTVENQGGSASGSMDVDFQMACADAWCDVGPNYYFLSGLEAGVSLTFGFYMTKPAGEYTLRFVANAVGSRFFDPYQQGPDGRAMESDYSNNELVLPFSVANDPVRGVEVLSSQGEMTVAPSSSASIVVYVTNTGNVVDTVQATTSNSTEGWTVTVAPQRIALLAGETGSFIVTATAPSQGSAKDSVTVTATSINDGAASASSPIALRAHPE